MLSSWARPLAAKVLDPIGRGLVRVGVTPNVVTVLGTLGTVVSALYFFPRGHLFLGAVVCGAFALFDMLDGAVARAAGGGTKFGAVLDASCDRVADGAIFGSLAYWAAFPPLSGSPTPSGLSAEAVHTGNRLLFVGLLICLVSALTISYVKARAEASGLAADGGWIERPERLIIVLAGAALTGLGVCQALPIAVAFLAVTSLVTVGQRIFQVWRDAQQQGGAGQPGEQR